MGAFFAIAFFFHFIIRYLELGKRFLLFVVYLAAFTFSFFNWYDNSRYFLGDIHFTFDQFYWIDALKYKNPLFFIFYISFFWVILGYGFFLLLKALQNSTGIMHNKLKYFIIAVGFGWIGTNPLFLPAFRISFYPYSNFLVGTYPLLVAYAIIRYQVMDIEVIIKKTIVFAGLFLASYAVLVSFAYLGSIFFENAVQNRWIAMGPFVLTLVLILRPLENFLRNVTDKYLFQKKYDYKQLLKTFTDKVLTVLDLKELVDLTVNQLVDVMKLENANILIHNDENKEFYIASTAGAHKRGYILSDSNRLVTYMYEHKKNVILKSAEIDTEIEKEMNKIGAELTMPLLHYKEMTGILILNKKKSDEEFTQDDIDVLLSMARALAVAITNAQLFDKLSVAQAQAAQSEKMAVIGTLSAGINHEICNPLSIIRGQCEMFLLNLKEGLYKNRSTKELLEKSKEIMQKVINEADRATVITRKLSSFSKPASRQNLDDVRVEDELDEVISLVEHDLHLLNIEIIKEIEGGLPCVSADPKQVQEIFFNIIRNAAQSIKGDGKVTIKAKSKDDKVFVDVEDTGAGINPENLKQIFNPFFTTKSPGKGTGLGLFIVRQIVEKNNGKISVQSELGKGTVVSLIFNAVTVKEKTI